jgi:hypothetical protein
MLVVLDNCEHLPGVVAVSAKRLLAGCPEVRIVATSGHRWVPRVSGWWWCRRCRWPRADLDNPLRLLVCPHAQQQRHQSLRAAISWSYDRLTGHRLLSHWSGPGGSRWQRLGVIRAWLTTFRSAKASGPVHSDRATGRPFTITIRSQLLANPW